MQAVADVIDRLRPAEPQLWTISGALQRWQSGLSKRASAETSEVIILVGLVENRKQIHLSDQERAALVADLCSLNENIGELRKRGEWVVRNKDYGRISFDVWLGASPVYTQQDLERAVQQRIRERKERLERINLPVEELEKAGLVEFAAAYSRRYALAMEPIIVRLKTRCRRVSAFIRQAPEEIKLEIKAIAEKKGLMKDDPYWRISLPFCAPHLLDEVEKIMRRLGVGISVEAPAALVKELN